MWTENCWFWKTKLTFLENFYSVWLKFLGAEIKYAEVDKNFAKYDVNSFYVWYEGKLSHNNFNVQSVKHLNWCIKI